MNTVPDGLTHLQEFRWDVPSVSCSAADIALVAAFANSPAGFTVLWGNVYLDPQGTAPMTICSARIINDPVGAFPQSGVTVDNQGNRIVLGFPILRMRTVNVQAVRTLAICW